MGKSARREGGNSGGGTGAAGGGGSVPVHTSAHVQLLGLGLDDSGVTPSVLLFFDKARYLFNAGEGFQARPARERWPRHAARRRRRRRLGF